MSRRWTAGAYWPWALGIAVALGRIAPGQRANLVLVAGDPTGTLSAAFGTGWTETTDAMMGGSSTVRLTVESANGGMALRVAGTVRAGPPFPWSGAMFSPPPGP